MKTYFVLWMLITSGSQPEWYVMKTYTMKQDCEEQVVYLAQALTNNTLKCLPSGTYPAPGGRLPSKKIPGAVGEFNRRA